MTEISAKCLFYHYCLKISVLYWLLRLLVSIAGFQESVPPQAVTGVEAGSHDKPWGVRPELGTEPGTLPQEPAPPLLLPLARPTSDRENSHRRQPQTCQVRLLIVATITMQPNHMKWKPYLFCMKFFITLCQKKIRWDETVHCVHCMSCLYVDGYVCIHFFIILGI